ncbi:MAG: hypothetical protein IAG10_29740 [Planctomycetaceae bacterium]|nr:hypothetical protein [Planctomycetaceae bacterium]
MVFDISPKLLGWLAVVSVIIFVGSAVALPWLLTRLPEDYFVEKDLAARPSWPRHRALYWAWRVLKNILGVVLLLAGLVMLVTPGQGILALLAGLWLLDLPGKRRWERRLVSRPKVWASINWIRQKFGQPPLQAPKEME